MGAGDTSKPCVTWTSLPGPMPPRLQKRKLVSGSLPFTTTPSAFVWIVLADYISGRTVPSPTPLLGAALSTWIQGRLLLYTRTSVRTHTHRHAHTHFPWAPPNLKA